jgi:chromosome segregation ATPase
LKFRGIAGMSFWFMFSVALSGVIGRYLYVQIPRSLNAAELTRKEVAEMQAGFARQLEDQNLLPQSDVQLLMKLPSGDRLKKLPLLVAIAYMIVLDVKRMFHLARLRRHAVHGMERVTTLGGLLKTRIGNLERAIETAREEASLSKRILFLSYSQRLFHLWHVVHKPFSYTFIILAVLHIGVQFLLGYL